MSFSLFSLAWLPGAPRKKKCEVVRSPPRLRGYPLEDLAVWAGCHVLPNECQVASPAIRPEDREATLGSQIVCVSPEAEPSQGRKEGPGCPEATQTRTCGSRRRRRVPRRNRETAEKKGDRVSKRMPARTQIPLSHYQNGKEPTKRKESIKHVASMRGWPGYPQ